MICIALAIPSVTPDWPANLQTMCDMAAQAALHGAVLILFSEAALTGFINTGDPRYDLILGQPIPGPATAALGRAARLGGLWIGVGLFERDGDQLYDSYCFIAPDGTVAGIYRRIDNHWHHWHSRPCSAMIYAEGERVISTPLPIGTTTVLLCGDLFNDVALEQVKQLRPDWLVVPMARGFDSELFTTQQWYDQDRFFYIKRAQEAHTNLLLVNQFAHWDAAFTFFGGAMAVTKDGIIIDDYPLEQAGMLYVTLE